MSRSRRWRWVVLVAALLGAAYGASGFAMAGSFTVSNPERLAHWQTVAIVYLAVTAACLVLAGVVAVSLVRGRWQRRKG
jgi:hypothetical protein